MTFTKWKKRKNILSQQFGKVQEFRERSAVRRKSLLAKTAAGIPAKADIIIMKIMNEERIMRFLDESSLCLIN